MKRNLSIILMLEALLCVGLLISGKIREGIFAGVAAFPFEQIGTALRSLSVSGAAGNTVAIAAYCVLCLLPIMYLLFRVIKKRAKAEDCLLVLLSAVLFAVIYWMINPAYLARHFGLAELVSANRAISGISVYSILTGYVVLRAMRAFAKNATGSMLRYLRVLLGVLCAVFIYTIFASQLSGLIAAMQKLTETNTALEGSQLMPSYIFLVIQYIVSALPHALSIVIAIEGFDLIKALEENQYGEAVVSSAQKISRICRGSVVAIMLSQISANILQLALGAIVHSSYYTLSIPLLSIIFVLAALLLAKYFEQARQLKDDNDSII